MVESGDGLYKVEHAVSEIDEGWNKVEYRYAGINPKNYVRFNNEIWRIISLVNVKTESGKIEQRLKIVRQDGINGQKDFGNYCWHSNRIGYTNNWLISSLKNMLNGIYYNSESGICDTAEYEHVCIGVTCEFNSGEVIPKGLKEVQSFIDNNIIWSLGGGETYAINANEMYEKEHGNITGNKNTNPTEWTKENDPEYHNGVGLMYSSDYGYAVGGGIRDICLSKNLYDYKNSCYMYNWIYHNSSQLFITPHTVSDQQILELRTTGFVHHYYAYNSSGVWPVVYLKPSVQILSNDNLETYGSIDNPFILN